MEVGLLKVSAELQPWYKWSDVEPPSQARQRQRRDASIDACGGRQSLQGDTGSTQRMLPPVGEEAAPTPHTRQGHQADKCKGVRQCSENLVLWMGFDQKERQVLGETLNIERLRKGPFLPRDRGCLIQGLWGESLLA